jgi:hypothetical protein
LAAAAHVQSDARREALELVARNLSDLRENMAKLNDEPLAKLVHRAWQRAASLLLKLPPADQPSGFDRPKLT